MGAKASIHVQPMKAMNASLSDENERRDKSKEWFDRTEDSKGTPYHYDWWRRNLNFEIVKGKICPQLSHAVPLHERIQNRLQELGFKNYKETAKNAPNVCMDFVIGGQRERLREMAFGKQYVNFENSDKKNGSVTRQKEIEKWALDTYRWAAKKYGEENIIGFNVHLDETTPHIHMQVIPVAEKKKRGRVKTGEERGTVKTVSYAGVVGETPEALAKYLDKMHTDYHIQVGYKYGLERGTFFDDLTPEEQARRKNRNKPEYIEYDNLMKELDKTKKAHEELKQENIQLEEQCRLLEKKVKSFTTMLNNLNEQREAVETDIAELEKKRENGNEEAAKKIAELNTRLNEIEGKIEERKTQLAKANLQLESVTNGLKDKRTKLIKTIQLNYSVENQIRKNNKSLENLENQVRKNKERLEKDDMMGVIARKEKHIGTRNEVIFSLWPQAKAAVEAIVTRTVVTENRTFTPNQASLIEEALQSSSLGREEAARQLMNLAQRDFDDNLTWDGWVESTGKEILEIARGTHFLTPLLQQQNAAGGGGSSYITDLTDWQGRKRR